jgi:hypothetical protein
LFEKSMVASLGTAAMIERSVPAVVAVSRSADRLKEALPLLEEAHRATKKDPQFDWVAIYLTDAYKRAGANDKAAGVLLERVQVIRSQLPRDSKQLGFFLADTSLVFWR